MIKKTLTLLALVGVVATTQAASIVGDIAFGSFQPLALTGGSQTFLTATGFDFFNGPNAIVNGGAATTGDFEPAELQNATFLDFTFAPLVPGTGIWTVTTAGFSFALNTVTVTRTATSIILDGIGIVSSTNPALSPTSGDFHFTVQGAGGNSFSFSSDSTVPSNRVPDAGSTVALLGAALTGLGLFRRKMLN